MTPPDGSYFHIGRRLTLTLALLIALILGGNWLVILQFERARRQTDRLTGVSQQLIAVLRLRESLLSFHQRLNDLAAAKDRNRLASETGPLRDALLEQTRQTRTTLAYLPREFGVDPTFLTALDTIEITLPKQLQDVSALAAAGDWEAVQLRLDNELKHIETTASAHVKSIDRDLDEELPQAVATMLGVQRRIFVVAPATAISTVLLAAFFGWAIARRMLELRTEERVSERTRIAREFHDTLLQSFQGVLMKFHVATSMIPDRPGEAQKMLEGVIEQAQQAVNEGRRAVQGLRSSTAVANDLARAITALGEALAAEQTEAKAAQFRLRVEGRPRNLTPDVREEVYRVASEAVRNAFRHAGAEWIDVEMRYERRRFRLRVRDDGTGIERKIVEGGGRAGHYGMPGMHERARLVGGRLAVKSERNAGTEIELSIPGGTAFAKGSEGRGATG